MNLNEAAETMRRYYDPKDPFDGPCSPAPDVLQIAMLSELDPTPITEEWLDKNGVRVNENEWLVQGICVWWDRERDSCNGFSVDLWGEDITTLGELRTLLRLCGAQVKENDA